MYRQYTQHQAIPHNHITNSNSSNTREISQEEESVAPQYATYFIL